MAKPKQDKKTAGKKNPQFTPEQVYFTPKMMEAEEIKTLLEWEAPSRPFRKRDRSYYTYSAIIVIVICLILLFASQFLLMGAVLSLTFVAYVLAFVPPHNIKYRISTQGVTIGEDFYFWHFLDAFWFKEKDTHKVLHIQTRLRFPPQLMLVLDPSASSGQGDEEKVKKIVAKFLPFVESLKKTWMEKWSDSLQKNFPLENPHR